MSRKPLNPKALRALYDALIAAREHLDYTGYGDRWERECAKEAKLEQRIDAAIAKAEKIDAKA